MAENKKEKPTIDAKSSGNDAAKYNAEVQPDSGKKDKKKKNSLPPEYEGLSKEEIKERERAEKKEWKSKRRTRRALKSYHGRRLKNFLLFLTGFLCAIIAFVGVAGAFGKIVPLKTFVGEDDTKISSKIYNSSAIDAILKINDYTLSDIPILEKMFTDFANDDLIRKYVTLDEEKLAMVRLVNIGAEIAACFDVDIDNIKISSFLEIDSSTQRIYDILVDGTGGTKTAAELTISDLNNFVYNNIRLSTVLPVSENQDTYDMLVDGLGGTKTAEEITISDISGFDEANIKLSTILPVSSNQETYDILVDGIGGTKTAEDITIGDLDSFDNTRIKLSIFLPVAENDQTYNILIEGIGGTKTAEEFTLGDIENFDIQNVTIDTVLTGVSVTDNAILSALMGKNITLGNMATEIDNLTIAEIYNVECFTKDVSKRQENTWTYKYKFNESDGSYTLADDGEYYISNEASIWLFVVYTYDPALVNSDGRAVKYELSGITFGSMKSEMRETMNATIQEATVRQLVDAGVLDGGYAAPVYNKSINSILSGS